MNEPEPKLATALASSSLRPLREAPLSRPDRLGRQTRQCWAILYLAVNKFLEIGGSQWAGAFAFNAFLSLFPAMVLLVTISWFFAGSDQAGKQVIAYIENYVPISGELQRQIFDTIAGVIKAREQAGAVAFLILVWSSLQCFTTLICATNRAWGTAVHNWWRLPLKSLALLGSTASALLLGMAVPVFLRMAEGWLLPVPVFRSGVYGLGSLFIPLLVVFFSLCLFYKLAPRRSTRFAEIWAAALCATILLLAGESLFVIYLQDFAKLNAVYGAFGGMMALLLWIYLSGSIFIFGACLSAGQAELRSAPVNTTSARPDTRGGV